MKRTLNLLTLIASLFAASAAQATVPGFGVYRYDGAGNIVEAAGESYAYDTFSRLRTATAGGHEQEFVYDRYGNIRGITTDGNAALAIRPGVNPANNWANLTHEPDTGAPNNMVTRHDLAGNVEIAPGGSFEYDALNTVTVSTVDGVRRLHLYSASDERLATLTATASGHRADWTVRDPAGRVLRRFASDGAGAWQWTEDYIYAGSGQLLAAEVPSPEKIRHFHLDHLGTPRLTTGNGGAELARHTYYPFGGELPDAVEDGERRKFTGHERDSASLDYMHARYYQPVMGRFLSVDPTWESADLGKPQSWNRYSYVLANPINATDPDGRIGKKVFGKLVDLVTKGRKTWGKGVEVDDMVRSVKEGEDVQVPTHKVMVDVGKKASPDGSPPVIDKAHGAAEDGYRAHGHVVDAQGNRIERMGHIFMAGVVGILMAVVPGLDAEATSASDARPDIEARAQEMFEESFFELDKDRQAAVLETLKPPKDERR
ncbi:MAG TPA: RHS repeat-associated core domain-containing protein [Thermoanaerobaculia bacterium]|nr:RHS repeat-associated core domain-containing protein [Thermoanaerobaculia bacterium]